MGKGVEMEGDLLTELLARHSEQLAAGEFEEITRYLELHPAAAEELEVLLHLAQAVALLFRQMPPAAIRPEWRAELMQDLLAQHRQNRVAGWYWRPSRTWAAVGVGGAAVAVAGLIVYWRGRQLQPPAA
jgi:anti-sigma factor RsiW